MLRNLATLLLLVFNGSLITLWVVHWVWNTRVRGVDATTSTVVWTPAGIHLVLNTANGRWLLVFLATSILQILAARRLFSDG